MTKRKLGHGKRPILARLQLGLESAVGHVVNDKVRAWAQRDVVIILGRCAGS